MKITYIIGIVRPWLLSALITIGLTLANPHLTNAQNINASSANTNTNANQPSGSTAPSGNVNKPAPTDKPSPTEAGADKPAPTDTNPKPAQPKVTAVEGKLALFNTISVTVSNLQEFLKAAGNDYSKIILYLDGYPLKGIAARPGGNEKLLFDLKNVKDSKESWNSLLGRPDIFPVPKEKPVSVTVGIPNQTPVETDINAHPMTVINRLGYWIFIAALILLGVLFVRWAQTSDVLRVGPRLADNKLQRYSLGRCQMAYWFFVVAASYVFIWMVTSEYGILPASVLALIGISAGTALGAVLIDASGPGSVAASVTPHPSAGFFNDIFSDEQGKLTFHRFQIFVWSIILGIIFIASVYRVLAMPDFPGELLALMGISSGTYLGFKFPEKQQTQNRSEAIRAGLVPPNVAPPNAPNPPNPPNPVNPPNPPNPP